MKYYKLVDEYPFSPNEETIADENGFVYSYDYNKYELVKSTNPLEEEQVKFIGDLRFWERVRKPEHIITTLIDSIGTKAYLMDNGKYFCKDLLNEYNPNGYFCGDELKSMITDDYSIFEVKRLRDNQVFKKGDLVEHDNNFYEITSIMFSDMSCIYFRLNGGNKMPNTDINIDLVNYVGSDYYITKDGGIKNKKDLVFVVSEDWEIREIYLDGNDIGEDSKIFSGPKSAKEYVRLNEPKYSLNDLKKMKLD